MKIIMDVVRNSEISKSNNLMKLSVIAENRSFLSWENTFHVKYLPFTWYFGECKTFHISWHDGHLMA